VPAQAPAADAGEGAAAESGEAATTESGGEAAAPAAGGKIKVKWLNHWSTPEETAYWDDVATEFEAQNPDIDIEILNTGFNDLMTTFMTQYGAGSSPDVFHIKYDLLPDLVEAGALLAPPEDVAAAITDEWSRPGVDGMTWDGKVWGYPSEIGLRGLMYNADLLAAAGVELPSTPDGFTFDEYAAAAKQVTDNTDAAGAGFIIQYEASTVENFVNLLWNNGGQFTNEDNTKALFNSPEGVEALTLLKNMVDDGSVALYNTDDMASALATESVAMYSDANWWKLMFFDTYNESHPGKDAQEVFKVTGVPYSKDKFARTYVFGNVVSAQSQHPEEAWKWAEFISAPRGEGQNSYIGEYLTSFYGIIPSNLQDQQVTPGLQEPYSAAYVELLNEYGRIQPVFPGYLEIQHLLAGEIEKVYQTGKDPQQALNDAAAAADEILAKNASQ
jgi:multiple sugar transport system substrate-binding protein